MFRRVLLHNTLLMPLRLTLALALSLALHAGVLFPDFLKRLAVAPSRPALQASLRLPPKLEMPPDEPLLKNTIDTDETPPAIKSPPKLLQSSTNKKTSKTPQILAVQRKLSEYVFYPEAARSRGIEGTVGLFLVLSEDGTIEDVRITTSSGYPILDNAAAKGAWAAQRLPSSKTGEYPYVFRLIP